MLDFGLITKIATFWRRFVLHFALITKIALDFALVTKIAHELGYKKAIGLTRSLIDTYGPRLTTTAPCTQAARALFRHFEASCDRAYLEDFVTQPNAMTHFIQLLSVIFYVSLAFFWLNLPQISFILESLAIFLFVHQFVLYHELIERFARDATAYNTYGVIEPREDVRNTVIFSGHHDSAHVFTYVAEHPQFYFVRIAVWLSIIVSFWLYVAWLSATRLLSSSFFAIAPRTDAMLRAGIGFTVAIIGIVPMWRFVGEAGTPGAGDNLISSAMSVVLSRSFGKARNLRHTRLVFASFDAEEILLKGSRAFYRRHRKEFNEVKTWNFNVDCPYFITELKFLTTDINGSVALSSKLANKLVEIAHELGYKKAHTRQIVFCAGGTDAAEAARNGIEATTLVGMPYGRADERGRENVYHTLADTIDTVDPEIVQATMDIFKTFVEQLDKGQFS